MSSYIIITHFNKEHPIWFTNLFQRCHCLEKLQSDFLWGGLIDEVKFHLVNWNTVCDPVQCGVMHFHNVLLGTWLNNMPMSLTLYREM